MSDKKKKSDHPCKDWILWWFSLISLLINLAIVAPPLPWRYARQTPYFGSDFVSDRSMSLLSVTDNFGQLMLWFKLKTAMCQRAREVSAPSIMTLIKTVGLGAVNKMQEKTGVAEGMTIGGPVVGCDAWQECKTAANTRCSSYGTVAGLGVGAVIFLLAAVVSSAVCLVFYSKEAWVKKKKKKVAAEFNTCVASVFAHVFTTCAALVWIFGSDIVFSGFQTSSYYPYPAASAGYFAVWFTFAFTFIAMFAGWRRQYHSKDDEDGACGEGPHGASGEEEPYGHGEYPPSYAVQAAQTYSALPYGAQNYPPYVGYAVPHPPPYTDGTASVPLLMPPPDDMRVVGADGSYVTPSISSGALDADRTTEVRDHHHHKHKHKHHKH